MKSGPDSVQWFVKAVQVQKATHGQKRNKTANINVKNSEDMVYSDTDV